jgi:hypothetical protein
MKAAEARAWLEENGWTVEAHPTKSGRLWMLTATRATRQVHSRFYWSSARAIIELARLVQRCP